jgi:two-component SAPR family response regulator
LIFADVRLRDVMEGIDLARKVKMRWPLLPVILTSGHPRERVGELPPGVGYMPKPLAAAQSADRYRNKHWHRGASALAALCHCRSVEAIRDHNGRLRLCSAI